MCQKIKRLHQRFGLIVGFNKSTSFHINKERKKKNAEKKALVSFSKSSRPKTAGIDTIQSIIRCDSFPFRVPNPKAT